MASPTKIMALESGNSPAKLNRASTMLEKNKSQLMALTPLNNGPESSRNQSSPGLSSANMSMSVLFLKEKAAKNNKIVAKLFEAVILTLIIISSITLVIDNPLKDPESSEIIFIGYMDNCFTVLFTIEMTIKIIAMGFLFNNKTLQQKGITPYIRNPWNMLDFIVVVSSLIDFVVTIQTKTGDVGGEDQEAAQGMAESLQSLKALRALRALRPLRMISRNKGMKLIVNALLSSIPSMSNVTIVCTLFLLIFAILGVGFFKGTFGSCSLENTENIFSQSDCINAGGEWNVPNETFDNTIIATRTLFEMMSTEGWIDVMNQGIDSVAPVKGEMMQPKMNNSSVPILYFVIFMVFGSQFILNLFVGVIMDNFNKIKEKEELGSLFVTEDQQAWIDA